MTRTRAREDDPVRTVPPPAGPGGSGLPRLRQAAQRFLEAGDAALERALSRDSEAFLRANVQQGGQ
jgi:hypothetical protein